MRAAIMQPYFFPYIGYFQLLKAVDLFVIYDDVKYTKKGWINRNRFLQNGGSAVFSLPLKNDSDYLDIRQRTISASFNRDKLLNKLRGAYRPAPFFEQAFTVVEAAVKNQTSNLFDYLHQSVERICDYLGIQSKILISSDLQIDRSLRSQNKVIAICKKIEADMYINPIGGQDLYTKEAFRSAGIDLRFLKYKPIAYKQFGNEFVPALSILDVMMFNSKDEIEHLLLHGYELLQK